MDLFDAIKEDVKPLTQFFASEEPEERATRRVTEVLAAGHPAVLAFSSGKDSSCLANITLNAARKIIEKGFDCPPIVVINADTGVEQPEVKSLAESEIKKMRAYALKHSIPFSARVSHPSLAASFPVRVIGGRALPAYPDSRGDCSTDWKVVPNMKLQKQVLSELIGIGKWKQPVVMTGVRQTESIARDQKISKRGETAEGIWENEFGALRLSPILDWSTPDAGDVWEYIGLVSNGLIDGYSDFEDLMAIYRDAGASSCVVIADMKSAGNSPPCGARHGCWSCTRVSNDRSMANMIESDPKRYGRLKPLARLRDFISHSQYDWSLRTFVGRTIDPDGYITIGADTFSPDMLARLLRYTLSAQELSRVPIISPEQLIAIDARWSMYGLHPPFSALKIYLDVVEEGNHVLAPELARVPKTPVPKIGKVYVGAQSYNSAMTGAVSGLRDVGAEFHHESCGHELKALSDGSLVIDVETGDEFTVDREGANDFITFIAPEMIEQYCHHDCSDWTWGYKTYLQYGTVQIANGRSTQAHEILQRSQWRQKHGLHGQQDVQSLKARCTELFPEQLAFF